MAASAWFESPSSTVSKADRYACYIKLLNYNGISLAAYEFVNDLQAVFRLSVVQSEIPEFE